MKIIKLLWVFVKELLVIKDLLVLLGITSISLSFINRYFTVHNQMIIDVILSLIVFYIMIYVYKLKKKILIGFEADLIGDINSNWDITKIDGEDNGWALENNELSVTRSHYGGLTKKGSFWEDYCFKFETKIINKQTAWIVRAKSPFEYLMFQCDGKVIVPHRLYLEDIKVKQGEKEIIQQAVIWKRTNEGINLPRKAQFEPSRWVKVVNVLKGNFIKIKINGIEVYHNVHPHMSLYGRVGFRNCGDEHAHFRKIQVTV
jgi:hypothetical protein